LRQETEAFEDGKKTVRSYDADDRLCCIETFAASGKLQAAIDYVYDAAGINVERTVRDATGLVLRRIRLDADGQEIDADRAGPVRWAAMDGSEEGVADKGQEKLGDN
jgi:hypothetical protein